jgi:hypothetical protein
MWHDQRLGNRRIRYGFCRGQHGSHLTAKPIRFSRVKVACNGRRADSIHGNPLFHYMKMGAIGEI